MAHLLIPLPYLSFPPFRRSVTRFSTMVGTSHCSSRPRTASTLQRFSGISRSGSDRRRVDSSLERSPTGNLSRRCEEVSCETRSCVDHVGTSKLQFPVRDAMPDDLASYLEQASWTQFQDNFSEKICLH